MIVLFLLVVHSVLAALLFRALHLPAAWLFGPLIVSVFFAIRGWKTVVLPKRAYCAVQAIIGTALGAGFSSETLQLLLSHLEMVAAAAISILFMSLLNGWVLARWTSLDTPTAFLGTLPGGASAMVAMSDSLQADTRLVAVMQYVRLLIILGTLFIAAPLLLHFLPHSTHVTHALTSQLNQQFTWSHLGILTFLTVAGYLAGVYTRIPAAPFLVPTLLEFGLGLAGISPGRWPMPIFATAYLLMGLQIGGRFQRKTLETMKGLFAPVIGTSLLLLIASIVLAVWLSWGLKLSPLSAYLAATPGGLDSVAAMAGELQADTSIILAIQMVRLLSVLLLGPWLVRGCTRWLKQRKEIG